MEDKIAEILKTGSALKTAIASDSRIVKTIGEIATRCKRAVQAGGTIYTCGNGGSSCDAMHFVEELVARFKKNRVGIRAMHFMDPSTMSCWSNDFSFESVFARQAATFCQKDDLLFGFTTSGNSKNVLSAFTEAKKLGATTVALTGNEGGRAASIADFSIIVPSRETERIQEVHITIVHILCSLIEEDFPELKPQYA